MKNQENYKVELENQIKDNITLAWCGEGLEPFTNFVAVALQKHLYDVMNSENKPTFEEWEELKVNSEVLNTLLERISEYQENEDFRLSELFKTA